MSPIRPSTETAYNESRKADRTAHAPQDANALFANILPCRLPGTHRTDAITGEMKAGRQLAERVYFSGTSYYDAYLAIGGEYLLSGMLDASNYRSSNGQRSGPEASRDCKGCTCSRSAPFLPCDSWNQAKGSAGFGRRVSRNRFYFGSCRSSDVLTAKPSSVSTDFFSRKMTSSVPLFISRRTAWGNSRGALVLRRIWDDPLVSRSGSQTEQPI